MKLGSFKQKANPILVYFVFSCILIITVLLHLINKYELTGLVISSSAQYENAY